MKSIINFFRRGKAWKGYVQATLLANSSRVAELEAQVKGLHAARQADSDIIATLKGDVERILFTMFANLLALRLPEITQEGNVLLLAQRGDEVLLLSLPHEEAAKQALAGSPLRQVMEAIVTGAICTATLLVPTKSGLSAKPLPAFLEVVRDNTVAAVAWIEARQPERSDTTLPYFERLDAVLSKPDLIDFFSNGSVPSGTCAPAPFDAPASLPSWVSAEPRRRSVLFLQHCYYNFFYLAAALRARGWDAAVLSTESPESINRKFYHGDDINLFSADPHKANKYIVDFFSNSINRYGIIHGYGAGLLSFFHSNYDTNIRMIPWDIIELKRRGILIGYSHSGCLDGVSQSAFRAWSPTMCGNCIWENRSDICSDSKNLAWGRKSTSIVDVFCAETDPPLDYKGAKNVFRGPMTFAVDPDFWDPLLSIPDQYLREREENEIIVYHAMGNYELRSREGRNVKGTQAVIRAVEELRAEGIPIRLDFVKDIPSLDNRFIQVQADIIVDQLNYGRYGALAREGMMLGKPVVGRVNKMDGPGLPATQCILETPIVHADEVSIKEVLRDLALNPKKRQEIGRRSREHAIKWWSSDRLAARFEQVYDHVREHGVPPKDADVP